MREKQGFLFFLNCKINISKKVFKPRIETEFWVKKALQDLKLEIENCKLKRIEILDIFAGTGCIGITALKNLKNSFVDFVDIDRNAILQIRINLEQNKIPRRNCRVYNSAFFETPKIYRRKYDVIFANPPYIAKDRILEVQKEALETEPKRALFSGKDGTNHIKRFLKEVKNHLKPNGVFFLEFDPLQKEKIEKVLQKEGLESKFYKDQFKKYRWLRGKIKN